MSKICDNTIGNYTYSSAQWEGRGFGRKFVATYRCAKCRQQRRMISSARRGKKGDIPPGAFTCGASIFEDRPVNDPALFTRKF